MKKKEIESIRERKSKINDNIMDIAKNLNGNYF